MSASQDKKRRAAERSEGTEKNLVAQQKRQKEAKRHRLVTVIISILLVLLLAAIIIINSSLFFNVLPAVTIGDTDYSVAEFNYVYFNAYYNYAESYGEYASIMGLDTTRPLDEQLYMYGETEGETWADFFRESAIQELKTLTMLANEAKAAGFTISEESRQKLEEELASLDYVYLYYSDVSSPEQFLTARYGRGFNRDVLRDMMELTYLASEYYVHKMESFEYSEDELLAHYAEHKDEYDIFTYRAYFISGTADEANGIDAETAMANAQETAENIKQGSASEEDFARLVYEAAPEASKSTYEDESSTLNTADGKNVNTAYSEWMLDPARTPGDVEVFDTGSGWYVVMFVSRDDNHYNLRMVRHILIKAQADEDGLYTDEAKETAKARADALLEEWESGDATEETFADFANLNSEDTGSNTTGGLYDTIFKGQMVPEFDAFCFDESRRPGDTGVVYGESSSYAGYHVMYYVGENEMLYDDYIADQAMRSADYTGWSDAILGQMTVETGFSLRFAQ